MLPNTISSLTDLDEKKTFVDPKSLQYCINFLWLNDKKNSQGEYVCDNIDYVLAQLKKWQIENPEAEINFWYDGDYSNEKAVQNTLRLLKENSIHPDQPIKLRNIREIPLIQQNKALFAHDIPIYFRIDILKLILCLHTMLTENMDSAIFTDFSIADKVEKTLNKSQLFNPDNLKNLYRFGMLIGFDGEKIENQFMQMINTPELIQALIHAINCCIYISVNTLNRLLSEEIFSKDNKVLSYERAADHITTMPFYAVQSYIYIYLLSMAHPEGVKIRADIVQEGSDNEWVRYDPEKHGFIMFGNHFKFETLETTYEDSKQILYNKDLIKLPQDLHINPSFNSFGKTFSHQNCAIGEEVIRHDLNPGHFGRSHEWQRNFSYTTVDYTLLSLHPVDYLQSGITSKQHQGMLRKQVTHADEINLPQSKHEELEMICRFAKEKNQQGLDNLIKYGYQIDSSNMENPLFSLARLGEIEALEFLLTQFKIDTKQAIIIYAYGNFVTKVEDIIIQHPTYTYEAIYGYALASHKEKVQMMLRKEPSIATSAITGYAIVGEVEEVNSLCKKYPWLISKAIEGYVIGRKLEPLLTLQNAELVAELCGQYGDQLFFNKYCQEMKLEQNDIMNLQECYDYGSRGKKIFFGHEFSNRIFTIISLNNNLNNLTYRFYRSGRSSDDHFQYQRTWFPMQNCRANGYIEKPGDVYQYQYPYTEFYPKQLVDFLLASSSVKFLNNRDEENITEIFSRFGNFDCMCLSYLIGGGYWDHDDSQALRIFLEVNFQPKLQEIIDSIQNYQEIKTITMNKIPKEKHFTMIHLPYLLSQFYNVHEQTYTHHFSFSHRAEKGSMSDHLNDEKLEEPMQQIEIIQNADEESQNNDGLTKKMINKDQEVKADDESLLDSPSDVLTSDLSSEDSRDFEPNFIETNIKNSTDLLKQKLNQLNDEFKEGYKNPNPIDQFFGIKRTPKWQEKAAMIRKNAWDYLIISLRQLNDDDEKIKIIKYAKTLPLFNKHTANYFLTKNTDYPRAFNILHELQQELEHKKKLELTLKLKLK